jgi:hypothetical protein
MLGVLVGLAVLTIAAPAQQPQRVESSDPSVMEFNKRIDEYMKVRQNAVSAFKPLKEDANQAEIAAREKALGEAIRTARASAKPGEIYPSTWPLQTFPPTLIATLPKLPPELEYRFVDNALILRDTKANIVVDFVLNVM